jgi:hypothetical protein
MSVRKFKTRLVASELFGTGCAPTNHWPEELTDIASDRIGSTAATTRNVGSVSAGRGRGDFDTA